jgi:S1-C subfamily serine protease
MRKSVSTLGTALLLISLVSCIAPTPSSPSQPPIATTPFILQLISDPKVKEAERASFMIKAEHPKRMRAGTGVWMGQGLILTAFHLIGDPLTGKITAKEITISQPHLGWKEGCQVKVAAIDPSLDLAVLKCKPIEELPSLSFGDPDQLLPGDTVYAIGHEFFPLHGIGILYPRDGEVSENLNTFFTISPPFIRGFSGGGVFNLNYELVGIAIKGYFAWDNSKEGGQPKIKQGTIVRKINFAFLLLEKAE